MSLIPVIKAEFSALSLQSSVPRDPSVSQETIIIINVENSCSALKLWCLCNVNVFTVTFEQFNESGLDKNFLSKIEKIIGYWPHTFDQVLTISIRK